MKTKSKGFLNAQKVKYAGRHILLEFWEARNIDSIAVVRKALVQSVKAAGATLLKIELHNFSPQGISGMAIIAESHISIHTWPEHRYAAIDIFTCGQKVKPKKAIAVLKKFFKPKRVELKEIKRGVFRKKK
ncbi:MAG: adenosylmethionine decarboxylase [Patescibacteria group bacterium]